MCGETATDSQQEFIACSPGLGVSLKFAPHRLQLQTICLAEIINVVEVQVASGGGHKTLQLSLAVRNRYATTQWAFLKAANWLLGEITQTIR
jgi:hypothetical protein